jgi:hypothetical protein
MAADLRLLLWCGARVTAWTRQRLSQIRFSLRSRMGTIDYTPEYHSIFEVFGTTFL